MVAAVSGAPGESPDLEREGQAHEPWCNTEEHPSGRCLRRVDGDGATATLLDAPAEDELRARLEVSAVIGETPRGDYRTSTGEPVGDPAPVAHPLGMLGVLAGAQADPQQPGEEDEG
jgi:hypothetical protein